MYRKKNHTEKKIEVKPSFSLIYLKGKEIHLYFVLKFNYSKNYVL